MRENAVLKAVMLAASKVGARVFRQNVGQAWAGDARKVDSSTVIIENARPLHAGLIKGCSDLVGWTPVTVTPDMVGRTLAVFTALECKATGGRATPEQENFVAQVRAAGGIAAVVRSPEEAVAAVEAVRGPAP